MSAHIFYPTRDPEYYRPDGDLIFRVEDTLFKIDSDLLDKNSAAFSELIDSLDTPASCCRGTSDDDCIFLPNITVPEIRPLFWYLYHYVPPNDPKYGKISNRDEEALFISVGFVAERYRFVEALTHVCSALAFYHSQSWVNDDPLTSTNLPDITKLAVLCGNQYLLDTVQNTWLELFEQERDLVLGMTVAEKYNLRHLMAKAYYKMMLREPKVWWADPILTEEQRNRLVLGRSRIKYLRKSLRHYPALEHDSSCTDTDKCDAAWSLLWKGTVKRAKKTCLESDMLDIVQRAWDIQNELPDLEMILDSPETFAETLDKIGMHPPCLENVWAAGVDKYEELGDDERILACFFDS